MILEDIGNDFMIKPWKRIINDDKSHIAARSSESWSQESKNILNVFTVCLAQRYSKANIANLNTTNRKLGICYIWAQPDTGVLWTKKRFHKTQRNSCADSMLLKRVRYKANGS